jgi:hypothetical protein
MTNLQQNLFKITASYSHLTDIVGGGLVWLRQLRIRLPGGCEAVGASALQERHVQAERQSRTWFQSHHVSGLDTTIIDEGIHGYRYFFTKN